MAALFTIAKRWKQPKCPLTGEWINKMWSIHTMEYYSALKSEILIHATTWMNLEDIMLSEISQSKQENIVWFHIYEVPRVVKFIEIESRLQVTRDCGIQRMGSYCLMDTEFLFGMVNNSGYRWW